MTKRTALQKKLQQPKRAWREVEGGLFELLKLVQEAGGVLRTVTDVSERYDLVTMFTEEVEAEGGRWGPYGARVQQTKEIVEFMDGSMLLSVTVSSFVGSMASHDRITVEWWYGTTR